MTTPAPSNVKGAVSWLITQAQAGIAQAPDHDLYVGYGEPMGAGAPDDIVFLEDVQSDSTMIGMRTTSLANPLEELLVISLSVSAFRANDEGQACFERCADLLNTIVAIVRTDPTMGGNVLTAHPQTVTYPTPRESDNALGRVCETTLVIEAMGINP